MKANKVLLGSFIVAGLAACTDDKIMEAGQNSATLADRPQVELELTTPVETRTTIAADDKMQVAYTSNDVLGAVLVDNGYNTGTNNVDWTIVDGHVGNNKWAYTGGKFQTAGTTAVGAWLFYTKYNEEMTTTRGGVKFSFPQIQEGAADYSWVANNNINFFISPVLAIDGYEGETISLPLEYASVYNNLRMAFDFSAITGLTKVQKIVVKATDTTGVAVKFPAQYVVKNKNLPIARLSINGKNSPMNCPDYTLNYTNRKEDQEKELERAYAALTYQTVNWKNDTIPYEPAVVAASGSAFYDYLVVDFDQTHDDSKSDGGLDVKDGKFSAVMLMPAGVYGSLTFEIYTDKGICTKTISSRNEYRNNIKTNAPAEVGKNRIFLRPQYLTILSDIENAYKVNNVATPNKAEVLAAEEYIKVVAADVNATSNGIITKTADLINLINGIVKPGPHVVNVINQAQVGKGDKKPDDAAIPAHSVVINKAVMEALIKKDKELTDIQLIFNGGSLKIKGESADAPLEIRDMTFNNGCLVENGYVKVTSQLSIPTKQTMTINSGANVDFSLSDQNVGAVLTYPLANVVSSGTITVSGDVIIDTLVNKGNLTVKEKLTNQKITNSKNVTVDADKTWTVAMEIQNNGTITNNGEFEVADGSSSDIITNNKNIKVTGVFENNDTIKNSENGLILATGSIGTVNNKKAIVNSGSMYCYQGNNTINNTGKIYAKKGSTTYITTNSALSECDLDPVKATATNAKEQVMGVIVLDRRNEDISVTTPGRQGYIEFNVPEGTANLTKSNGDKFNKILVNGDIQLNTNLSNRVKYIVVNKATELTLPDGFTFQEIEFNAKTTLYTQNATVAEITIAKDVQVKVPTENTINVYDVTNATSKTTANIINGGSLIVGGDLYSSLPKTIVNNNGIFASGDGNTTAFHWGE